MDAKYVQAIKAGIIGGVILAACVLLDLIIAIISSQSFALSGLSALSCCVSILMVIVLIGVGALAAFMAKGIIVKIEDALVIGAVAGVIAGVIGTVMEVVVSVVKPWLVSSPLSDYYSSYYPYDMYGLGSNIGQSTLGIIGSICCCGPALIIVGAILAAIGAVIYAVVFLKIK